jgi:hypothetical protein
MSTPHVSIDVEAEAFPILKELVNDREEVIY